jgi:hypothetical protein
MNIISVSGLSYRADPAIGATIECQLFDAIETPKVYASLARHIPFGMIQAA